MKTKKFIAGAFLLLFGGISSYAQTNTDNYNSILPQVPYLSPEASSLGKYGIIPVGEYSGVPSIKIPIYTLKVGKDSLPLTLDYHASGIKVNQEATWVGLGWDLDVGGCINYIVSGSYDKDYSTNAKWDELNRFYQSQHAPAPGVTNGDNSVWGGIEENPHGTLTMGIMGDLEYGMCEPDIYQVNLLDKHLCFIIHPQTNQPYIIGNSKDILKIESTNSYCLNWIITTTDGTKYYFQQGAADIIRAKNDYTSTWHLSQIVYPGNNTGISVSYANTENSIIYMQPALSEREEDYSYNRTLLTYHSSSLAEPKYENGLKHFLSYEHYSLFVKYPEQIRTPLETVNFYKSGRDDIRGDSKKLDSIIVHRLSDGKVIKRISFTYAYFPWERTGGDYMKDTFNQTEDQYRYKRLKLLSIKVDDLEYRFEYNASSLPYKTSFSRDFWDYYNGQNNSSLLCTPLTSSTTNISGNRYADVNKVKSGMLEKIVYPTKGYSTFDFESNTFNDKNLECINANDANAFANSYETSYTAMDCQTTQIYRTQNFSLTKETGVSISFVVYSPTYKYHDLISASAQLIQLDGSKGKLYQIPVQLSGEDKNSYTFAETLTLPAGHYLLIATFPKELYTSSDNYRSICQIKASYKTKNDARSLYKGFSYGGGLRVKSIKNYDSNNQLLSEKIYTYNLVNGNTSGKLLLPIPTPKQEYRYCGGYTNDGASYSNRLDEWILKSISSGVCIPAITSLQSGSIGYSQVEVNDVSGALNNGSTVSYYRNEPAEHDFQYATEPHDIYLFCDGGNGDIINQVVLNNKRDTVKVSNWEYQRYSLTLQTLNARAVDMCPNVFDAPVFKGLKRFHIEVYPFYTYWNDLSGKHTLLYTNNKSEQTVNYQYNVNNHLPASIESSTSLSNIKERTDIYYPDVYPNDAVCKGMVNQNMIDYPIEIIQSKEKQNGRMTISRKKNNYAFNNYTYNLDNIMSAVGDSQYETICSYKYNIYNNVIEARTLDSIPITYLWSYVHQYPVMKIVGMCFDDVENILGNSTIQSLTDMSYPSEDLLMLMKGKLNNALTTVYHYDPLIGIKTVINPNGCRDSYQYDIYRRLEKEIDNNGKTIKEYIYHPLSSSNN